MTEGHCKHLILINVENDLIWTKLKTIKKRLKTIVYNNNTFNHCVQDFTNSSFIIS